MDDAVIEAMVVFALERLLSGDDAARDALVQDMAARWPDVPALSVVLALTDAAARIDATLDRWTETRDAARHGYRMAALTGCEVFALEVGGRVPVTLRDLASVV